MSNPPMSTGTYDENAAKQQALAELCNERSYPITNNIQPLGLMFVLDRNLVIRKVSQNVGAIGRTPEKVLGKDFLSLVSPARAEFFKENVAYLFDDTTDASTTRLFLEWEWNLPLPDPLVEGFAYRSGDWLCLEAELLSPPPPFWGLASLRGRALNEIPIFSGGLEDFADLLTTWMRKLLGFDRVYCFRFDAKKNGVVIGESRNERFPSLRAHHFPASDIPINLHEIYKRSRFRYLADRDGQLVPLVEASGSSEPLDLSLSLIRQIAPSHLRYLTNMQVQSTVSFSIVINGQLWGLLGGHHASPRRVSFRTLVRAQQLVELFASRVQAITEISDSQRLKIRLDYILELTRNFDNLSCNFEAFANQNKRLLMDLAQSDDLLWCDGLGNGSGSGLSPQQTEALIDFAKGQTRQQSLFKTTSLVEFDPSFAEMGGHVSGIIALAIDENELLIWTRKEQLQHRKWGGNPNHALQLDDDGKVGPRHSFATWVQQVHNTALPWEPADLRAIDQLRIALTNVKASHAHRLLAQNSLLQKEIQERKLVEASLVATTDSLRETNKQLESFAYVASHDLQEPLRMIASYSQLLEKRYGQKLDGEARQYLDFAVEGAKKMRTLIDNILDYSKLASLAQLHEPINLADAVEDVKRTLAAQIQEASASFEIGALPVVMAEKTQLHQLLMNLIANALKFRKTDEAAHIEISATQEGAFWRVSIKDNGIGIRADMQKKVFELFQRLTPRLYSGSGIGLATCQRIVELHGGRIWCESAENEGSTFSFTLPACKDLL